MYRLFILLTGLVISIQSFAHEGHDHSDPMSSLIHLFWLAPLIIGAGLLVTYVKRRYFSSTKNNTGISNDDV
jgi:hypothetical protein